MVATHHISSDFDGDGRSDLLWVNDDSRSATWLGTDTGAYATSSSLAVPRAIATGDFNGDGRADFLVGSVFVVESARDGTFFPNWESAFTVSAATNWAIAGTGDFNGDGIADILWRNSNGSITNWLGFTEPGNLNFLGDPIGQFHDNVANAGTSVSLDWKIVGIGDFNGDGRDDILWREAGGRLTDWLGAQNGGFQPNGGNLLDTVSTDWKVDGVGDFNGDGKADILWRNDDGRITDWLGTSTGAFIDNVTNAYNSVSLDWHVADIGDYNGDHWSDIVWRNDDGRVTNWLGTASGGFQPNAANSLYSVPNDWHIVAHDGFFHF